MRSDETAAWRRCVRFYADFAQEGHYTDDGPSRPTPRTPIPLALTAEELQARSRGL